MKKTLLSIFFILLPLLASSQKVEINGINYNLNVDEKTAEVTNGGLYVTYSGEVVIPNSIEYLGDVYSVTSIGWDAFSNCSGLTSVIIPNSVTSIGERAFYDCEALTSVSIPNSVTSIDDYAFFFCLGLTYMIIPNSVTSIGKYAFSFCSGLTSVTIPNSVNYIGSAAFSQCSSLNSITIPNNLSSINEGVFRDCSNMNSITIPNSVTSIGVQAFAYCSSLTSLTIPNSVTFIGDNAFSHCIDLSSVSIPNSVISIGSYAFTDCIGLTSVTIPHSVTSIGHKAFQGCSGLTSVEYLCNPISIGSNIFANCSNIKSLFIDCEEISPIFSNLTSVSKITMTDRVITIGKDAFNGCSGLYSVTIPNSVNTINERAFYGCSDLTSVIIGNSVTSIGDYSFYNCIGLCSIVIGSGVTSIGDGAFSNDNYNKNCVKTIWLTNTPPSGYRSALGSINYVSNEQYNIDNKVVYPFLSSYFDVDGIRYVPVSPSERICDAIDCVYDESAENISISATTEYKGVTMTVQNVQPYLAYKNQYIKTLVLDNEGMLGDYAFTGCINLEKVQVGEKLTTIGKNAFQGCSSLASLKTSGYISSKNDLYVPKTVNTIGNYAFDGCTLFENVIISDSENELILGSNGNNPLFSSFPLDSVYIGRNITYNSQSNYGYSPFYRNTSLRSVKITDKETEILANEFYGCTNLQRVGIGDGVTTIGDWAFSGCQSLKLFAFGSQVQTIGKEAFSDCTAVVEISSKASTPPTCGTQALDDINKWECKLFVPEGTMTAYQAADQWKDFFFIEEGFSNSQNSIASVWTNAIHVESNGSTLDISGADAGTAINVYDTAGRLVGSAQASAGTTTISTTLQSGEIGIVKIGDKAVKVVIK